MVVEEIIEAVVLGADVVTGKKKKKEENEEGDLL